MKFTLISALTLAFLMTSDVQAVSLKQALVQIQSDSYANLRHNEVLSQLESAAKAQGFWDFLKKAGDWIKNTAH
jgi:hypothetical protein